MASIAVIDTGRAPGLNFVRALRKSKRDYRIIGLERSADSYFRSEVETRIPVSEALLTDPERLNALLAAQGVDLLYASTTDDLLTQLSRLRDRIDCVTFLPDHDDLTIFDNKWTTYERLRDHPVLRVPDTFLINDAADIDTAFEALGDAKGDRDVWIRASYGSGGAGSIRTASRTMARSWIEHNDGYGNFTISRIVDGRLYNWTGVWRDGQLLAGQGRERLFWQFSSRAASGVTGITGAQIALTDAALDTYCEAAVRALSAKPNGVIGVDGLIADGVLWITEIQAGRFFTSMQFLAEVGKNLPDLFIHNALTGLTDPEIVEACPDESLVWLKYVEQTPRMVTRDNYEAVKLQLKASA